MTCTCLKMYIIKQSIWIIELKGLISIKFFLISRLITTDINKFCNALATVYSNLGKPVLDLIIFNYQLARSIGVQGMSGLILNYIVTATILRFVTPGFGKMTSEEARLEVNF